MTHRLNFITGIAMLVLAGTLAFTISRRPPAVPDRGNGSASDRSGIARDQDVFPLAASQSWDPVLPRHDGSPSRPTSNRPRASAGLSVSPPARDFSIRVDPDHPQLQELLPAAGRVERHTRARLDTISRALDLTPVQQRRIVPALVRSSDSYHPAMSIVVGDHASAIASDPSAPALTAEESTALIESELDPGQKDRMVEHSIADLMLWEEIIASLIQQLDQPTVEESHVEPIADEAVTPEPLPSSRGGRNLFESAAPAD